MTTIVVFRMDKEGIVFALFPELPSDNYGVYWAAPVFCTKGYESMGWVGSTRFRLCRRRSEAVGRTEAAAQPRQLRQGPIPQRTVRTPVVVLQSPSVGQVLGLGQTRELLQVGQLVSQPAVERLGVAVLPRRARLDVERLYARQAQPPADRPGDELRPVVAADVLGTPRMRNSSASTSITLSAVRPRSTSSQWFTR